MLVLKIERHANHAFHDNAATWWPEEVLYYPVYVKQQAINLGMVALEI